MVYSLVALYPHMTLFEFVSPLSASTSSSTETRNNKRNKLNKMQGPPGQRIKYLKFNFYNHRHSQFMPLTLHIMPTLSLFPLSNAMPNVGQHDHTKMALGNSHHFAFLFLLIKLMCLCMQLEGVFLLMVLIRDAIYELSKGCMSSGIQIYQVTNKKWI